MAAPCDDWTTVDEVRNCGPVIPQDDPEVQVAITAAQEWLWAKSGRQFGVCEITVRPTSEQFIACDTPWWGNRLRHYGGMFISSTGYNFWNGMWCGCHVGDNYVQASSCGSTPAISLGYAPIQEVTAVTIDGVVLDPALYTVVDGEYLLRTDGQLWPCCQQRQLPLGQPGTWSVALRYGPPVPALGNLATRALARFLLSLCPDGNCSVASQATSLTRQGMVVEMADPALVFTDGHTGIPEVNAFVDAYNPNQLQQRSVAVIPGMTPYSTTA